LCWHFQQNQCLNIKNMPYPTHINKHVATMLVRPPGNCPTCPCVPTALISGAYEERIMCTSLLFQVCVGAECKKKTDPTATHTHFCYGGRWPTFGGKNNRNSWNICMEAENMQWITMCFACQFCILTSTYSSWLLKLPLSVHIKSLFPHFLTHSYTSVYELFNFKIVSQKVVHVCIILYSQI
jgi:hypothetical protein